MRLDSLTRFVSCHFPCAAILGFVVQEALYGKPIIDQTPYFFHPVSGLF
jgi:hypothetical protein